MLHPVSIRIKATDARVGQKDEASLGLWQQHFGAAKSSWYFLLGRKEQCREKADSCMLMLPRQVSVTHNS